MDAWHCQKPLLVAGCDLHEMLHATKEYPVVTDFDFAFGQSRPRKEVGATDLLQDFYASMLTLCMGKIAILCHRSPFLNGS